VGFSQWEDADMIPILLAGMAALGMAGVIAFGATRIFRPRRIDMVDYPELPAPPPAKAPPADQP
jgi:hypothetical protein